jgi:hypothetical protein
VAGLGGRESGLLGVPGGHHSARQPLQPVVEHHPGDEATVNPDAWPAYNPLAATGRPHVRVCHTPGPREWARDDDGDGGRDVHGTTREGIWTGLRTVLRLLRGVNNEYLRPYTAVLQVAHDCKRISPGLLRAMMLPFTPETT